MINGPDTCEFNKMDTLIVALGLEVAIREGMLIEEEVEEEEGLVLATPPHSLDMDLENNPNHESEYIFLTQIFERSKGARAS